MKKIITLTAAIALCSLWSDASAIITKEKWNISTDSHTDSYYVHDSSGQLLNTIFEDADNDEPSIELFSPQLNKFQAGGSGTVEDPFLVSTTDDLMQISSEPDAHFRITNDIDAENITMPKSETPFNGSIDGCNHVISNLSVTSSGLLGSIVGVAPADESSLSPTVIKDIIFYNPTIELDSSTSTSGLLAASASQYARISNVHIFNLNVEDSSFDSAFGAIVGELTNNASASQVSVNKSHINIPNAVTVGGIAARLRTAASIDAAAFNGSIIADNEVGGIIGNTFDMNHSTAVTNCHVSADITAKHTLGGIIGSDDHSLVKNNVAHGKLKATDAKGVYGPCIGGIIGSLAYLAGSGDNISGNIAAQQSISYTKPNPAEGVESYACETYHRIIGETDYNSYGEDQDGYLRNNFALEPLPILNDLEIYAGPHGLEGATVTKSELNASFLEFLGFAFGNETAAPWDENSAATAPKLYYEDQPMALTVDCETFNLYIGDNGKATFTIVGGSSDDMEVSVSNDDDAIDDVNTLYDTDDTIIVSFSAVAEGSASINVTCDSFTRTITILVTECSGINDIAADATDTTLSYDGKAIHCSEAGSRIIVYNAAGAVVATGETNVDLSSLSNGIYIAATATDSIKIAK